MQKKYSLTKKEGGFLVEGRTIVWVKFNEKGTYESHSELISSEASLVINPGPFYTWQTTLVKDIIEQTENRVEFKTKNSHYILEVSDMPDEEILEEGTNSKLSDSELDLLLSSMI
jgi:hypothetical protein